MALLRLKQEVEENPLGKKIRDGRRKLENHVTPEKKYFIDIVAVLTLFATYFYLNWVGSGPHVPYDYIWKIVEPYRMLPGFETLEPFIKTGWGTSGKQFFFFPLLFFTGVSPFVLKVISTAGYALVGPVIYAGFSRKFDRYIGFTAAGILITMRVFQKWRNGDMFLFLLFSFLAVTLYMLWQKEDDSKYLYGFAAASGFGMYAKFITIYPSLALLLSGLVFNYGKFLETGHRNLLKAAGFFVAGAAPFLIYSFLTGFSNMDMGWTLQHFPGIIEALSTRYGQFHVITAAGTPIANAVMQEGFHIYSALFVSGAAITLVRRRDLQYLGAFVLAFIFSFITPQADFPIHQIMVVYPFVLVVMSQNLVELKRFTGLHRLGPVLVAAVIFMTWGHLHLMDIHPGSVTMGEYDEFEDLELDKQVATNHRHGYALTMFDDDIEGRAISGGKWEFQFFIPAKSDLDLNETLEMYHSGEASLLLIKNGTCKKLFYGAERCGAATIDILNHGSLDPGNATVFSGPRQRYEYYVFD